MKTTRRSFMIAIGAIPFLGAAVPKVLPNIDQQSFLNPLLCLLRKLRYTTLCDPKFEWPGGYNYAQLFKTTIVGDIAPEKLAMHHDRDIELALWFGRAYESPDMYRLTRGMFSFMETNKHTGGLWDQGRLKKAFKHGDTVKFLFASVLPENLYKKYNAHRVPGRLTYGMDILRIKHEYGEMNCILADKRYPKYSAILDLDDIKLRVFRDQVDMTPLYSFETKFRVSELGLQVNDERHHSGILET